MDLAEFLSLSAAEKIQWVISPQRTEEELAELDEALVAALEQYPGVEVVELGGNKIALLSQSEQCKDLGLSREQLEFPVYCFIGQEAEGL